MKSGFLEKLLTRLDLIDPAEAQQLLSRLIREKGFLEQVFEALHEGVIILDEEGIVSFINDAAERFFGLDDGIIGQRLMARIPGLDWENFAKPGKTISRDIEVFYPENRYLNFYLSPIKAPSESKAIGWVMLVRDQTASRREALDSLESERLNSLTLLAAGVAHEIGNPLNSLDIHLQLLDRKLRKLPPGDRAPLEEHLGTARREIQRLDTILRQFLQAIRPTTPQREACQLKDVIRDTLQLLEPELAARKVSVELQLDRDFPLLQLDPTQLQQVFYNLLRNAYQSLPSKGGLIKIATSCNGYECRVAISDNGCGISSEQMGSLFEPFQSTKESGTGLGLLIVRRVLRDHGGELEIESEPGTGTTIQILIPSGPKPVRMLEIHDPIIDIGSDSPLS